VCNCHSSRIPGKRLFSAVLRANDIRTTAQPPARSLFSAVLRANDTRITAQRCPYSGPTIPALRSFFDFLQMETMAGVSQGSEADEEIGNDAKPSYADRIVRKQREKLKSLQKIYTNCVRRLLMSCCEEQGHQSRSLL
jgi:hypothetical protein